MIWLKNWNAALAKHNVVQGALILVTSCECCQMCLSAALGAGMEYIEFATTRQGAADRQKQASR